MVTVEVTEKQAQQLYQIEKEKTYKLVLNSRRDEVLESTEDTSATQEATSQDTQN